MTEHVIVIAVDAGERHDEPVPQRFRYAARAFCELIGHRVRLLKVRLIGVDEERLSLFELARKQAAESRLPSLRHSSHVARRFLFFRIEVKPEVRSLEYPEIEVVVLN